MLTDSEPRTRTPSENSPLLGRSRSPITLDRNILTPSPFSRTGYRVSIFTCAVVCILVTELCERLTFYGILGNLVLFATDEHELKLTPSQASILSYIFQGTCFTLPVFAGWLADSVAGRFPVIFFSAIIYLVGAALLPIGSLTQSDGKHYFNNATIPGTFIDKKFKLATYLTGLVLVALGTGGIKANVSPFGADQVVSRGSGAIQAFFIWFYWFINIGAFIAFTVVVYVQQDESYFLGYLIPAGSIIIALIIFLAGKRSYQIRQPAGSVLSTTLKIVKEAIRNSRRPILAGSYVNHWLDRAKMNFGGNYTSWEVEDVKKVYRLLPIFATFILYWTVYAQMSTAMVYQGEHMKIKLGSFYIPIASLSILDTIGVLVLIPIMSHIVYPLLAKCHIVPTELQRVGVGMVIAAASMVCAGGIETYRTDQSVCCHNTTDRPSDPVMASNVSIFFQVPQYTLIGLSEVFTSVTGLELAYTEAPKSLQGLVMGIFLLTTGLGTYVGAAVVAITNALSGLNGEASKWYPDEEDINDGKLAYYFFLLAGLMGLNFILYIFVALNFKAKKAAAQTTGNAFDRPTLE